MFDISHAFPTLLTLVINDKLDKTIVKKYKDYILNNDIYTDALEEVGLEKTKENRNKIKPYFNKFILSTQKDVKRNLKWLDKNNNPKLFARSS